MCLNIIMCNMYKSVSRHRLIPYYYNVPSSAMWWIFITWVMNVVSFEVKLLFPIFFFFLILCGWLGVVIGFHLCHYTIFDWGPWELIERLKDWWNKLFKNCVFDRFWSIDRGLNKVPFFNESRWSHLIWCIEFLKSTTWNKGI